MCFYGGHSTGYKLGNHPKNIEPCAHRARTVRAPCAHRATTPPKDALMPDCGVHYLWFAFVCFLIRSPPPPLAHPLLTCNVSLQEWSAVVPVLYPSALFALHVALRCVVLCCWRSGDGGHGNHDCTRGALLRRRPTLPERSFLCLCAPPPPPKAIAPVHWTLVLTPGASYPNGRCQRVLLVIVLDLEDAGHFSDPLRQNAQQANREYCREIAPTKNAISFPVNTLPLSASQDHCCSVPLAHFLPQRPPPPPPCNSMYAPIPAGAFCHPSICCSTC